MTTAEKPAFILIRFSEALFLTCKNSLTKQLSVTENYGGKVLGICHAEDIHVAEGEWPKDRGLAVLSFPRLEEARRWEYSVPEIRQADWLAGVDIVMTPVDAACDRRQKCFSMLLYRTEPDACQDEEWSKIAEEAKSTMNSSNMKIVVNNNKALRLRGAWETYHMSLSQTSCLENIQAFRNTDCSKKMAEIRNCYGESTVLAFKLENLK